MTAGAEVAWGWGETVYYLQNYNTSDIDWSTNTTDRFTPIIVNDGGNLYLAADSSTARQRAWLDNIEAVEYMEWLNSVYKKLDLKPIAHPIDYCNGAYNIVEVIRINKP